MSKIITYAIYLQYHLSVINILMCLNHILTLEKTQTHYFYKNVLMNILSYRVSTSKINNVLNINNRTCPTRIATGMRSVSNVRSAAALWWKRPLRLRMICCSALNATPTIILPSAPAARKPSCQV